MSGIEEKFTRQNAEIIKQQLGGSRFAMMVGAKDFMFDSKGSYLSFKIGSGAKEGINYVKVIYDKGGDDYTMEFCVFRGLKVTVKHRVEGVYGDQLQDIFEKYTGFYTTLVPRRESVDVSVTDSLHENSYEIQNPTIQKVIDYISQVVRDHRSQKSDLEYAVEDLEKVQRALQVILRSQKK